MKQVKCDMCGSTDLVKQDGTFVCQNCGIKYSIEEAKKMMVEIDGTVEVTGTVKVDNTDEIDNLLIRAKQFEEENQPQKALEYYNKVLDIDANNQVARARILELRAIYIGTVEVSKASIEQIDSMMANNRKLDAIKYVREISGLGLADAKTWVENYKTYDLHQKQDLNTLNSALSNNGLILNSSNSTSTSGGCYVATCVYGSYDCPEVWTLRRFRDDTLGSTWYGRLFIHLYYAISPTLVKWFGNTNWFKNLWRGTLNRMVASLQTKGVEDTPYDDKVW